MRVPRLFVLTCLLGVSLAACAPSAQDDSFGSGDKADDFGLSCPTQVKLNQGSGSQRRCINADNGQFVASACCADVCEGADWLEQSNGPSCRWDNGQFAPRMCCELNDALACSGAQLVAGSCKSQDGEAVDSVCCKTPPVTCHPMVSSNLRECVQAVVDDVASDSEALPIEAHEALALCAEEGDLLGPMLDELCAVDASFCQLSFETFALEYVAACRTKLTPQYDCALGQTFGDISRRRNIVVAETRWLSLSDAQALSSQHQDQIILASKQSATTNVSTLAEAFAVMDSGQLRYLRFWEGSQRRALHAFEFGAGDNSFGAIFDSEAGTLTARIVDGDLYNASTPAQLGCELSLGTGWQNCSENADCVSGLTCFGKIDEHPAQSSLGKCVDLSAGQGVPQNGMQCQSANDCPLTAGLLCSGTSIFGSGFCRPAWMFASFSDQTSASIPSGTVERDLYVYGLATVPEDARIRLELSHPNLAAIKLTVVPAMRDQGTIATVFDGGKDAAPGQTHLSIDANLMHPGDEDLNGQWTLVIENSLQPGSPAGALHGWSIDFSSRFD